MTIPFYQDKETMHLKLHYAISHCVTFANY
jgi:hypothetical protein